MRNPKLTKHLKVAIVTLIVVVTLIVFIRYILDNPEVTRSLVGLDFVTLALLTLGYGMFTLINAWILYHSLCFIGKRVPMTENILLTGYSSIINFFGPLQSGPGVRAIYLKKRHGVKLRDFFAVTIVFYGFFAVINGTILLVAGIMNFQSIEFYLLLAVVFVLCFVFLRLTMLRVKRVRVAIKMILSRMRDKDFWLIGIGSLALTTATVATYFVEIHHVSSAVSPLQALIYTAAANLSLFVSLTPGAIGIRESFLVLSQQLHGIDTATIVAVSIIDRAFYVIFLFVMFVVLLALNSRIHLFTFKRRERSV